MLRMEETMTKETSAAPARRAEGSFQCKVSDEVLALLEAAGPNAIALIRWQKQEGTNDK